MTDLKRGRQWPWYVMQLAVIGGCLYCTHLQSVDTGKPPAIGVGLIIGVALAAVATGIVAKLIDLLLAARAALARLVRNQREPSSDGVSLTTGWAARDGSQQIPRLRINQDIR